MADPRTGRMPDGRFLIPALRAALGNAAHGGGASFNAARRYRKAESGTRMSAFTDLTQDQLKKRRSAVQAGGARRFRIISDRHEWRLVKTLWRDNYSDVRSLS